MELRPAGTPIDDPFLAAVRRRHPDVDLVELPPVPEGEPVEPVEPVDDATVAQVAALVDAAAASLWSAVAPGTGVVPRTRVQYADREADVRAVARVVEPREDGYAVLVALRHELEQRGWTVHRPPGGLERLEAALEGGRLRASYAEGTGTVLVELSSAPLPVGVARARELVR